MNSTLEHENETQKAFNSTCKLTKCNQKMVQMVLADYKIFNAEVLERNDILNIP